MDTAAIKNARAIADLVLFPDTLACAPPYLTARIPGALARWPSVVLRLVAESAIRVSARSSTPALLAASARLVMESAVVIERLPMIQDAESLNATNSTLSAGYMTT
ncbi:MAG: hypothetical protein A2428_12740 [Bdellovibrionales bacterium RIFOXYC1_FULL_54_43]|nr:MAG: hypothetical protein A2428_12740 [Bdellovibrionales bacterium RIFOXYC1_FULL_54_43]OFZ81933.1 MAG: hypothetical protein A2603_04255 [Bdellovibrionales bacterium RIFOXYD1_FULL_55_31]